MQDICENCNFYNLKPENEQHVPYFVEKLNQMIDNYEKLEARQVKFETYRNGENSDFDEQELDTASEDELDYNVRSQNSRFHNLPTIGDEDYDSKNDTESD